MNISRNVAVVYDGECPVCTRYVAMLRLRELAEGNVELINAREDHPLVEEVKSLGLSLDEGMVVKIGDQLYHGSDAVQQLALLTGSNGFINRIHYWIFSSAWRSRALYPILRTGRNILLKLLGRSLINPK